MMHALRTTLLILLGTIVCVAPTLGQTPTRAFDSKTQLVADDVPGLAGSSDPVPSTSSASSSDQGGWHLDLSPYLWFAGTHGTVGAFGRDASVHASAGDLLSHFNFGIMGASEAYVDRFVLSGDLLWIRLSDSSALPFAARSTTSADVRVGQFVWTSKIGYRLIDSTKLKADANVGVRFWHLGQSLNFSPSILGINISSSQSWADIIVGGKVEVPFGPKASITALGDVGGWNATAKLDYQFAGLLNFKASPKWTVSAGYRYLFVDYRSGASIYNMVTPGAILGLTYTVGGTNRSK